MVNEQSATLGAPKPAAAMDSLPRAPGGLAVFWASFAENKGAVLGLIILTIVVLTAIFAGYVAPHDPLTQFRTAVKVPPVWEAGGRSVQSPRIQAARGFARRHRRRNRR